jgi:quinol monooxygenase YgiN
MFGIFFRVEAQPGKYDELLAFLKWDGERAREHEPGTLRFEFYRDPQDVNALYVYEAYRDRDAFEEHKKGEPFQRWSEGLRDALGTNFTVTMLGDAVFGHHGYALPSEQELNPVGK